jgi:ribonuclease G
MSKEMVISATPHETRVAILEEGQLCEIYVEREKEFALVGSIYKGRVTRVLPGMQSAFVEIGLDSDAFLYVSDFLEDIEEYDQIVTTVEDKVQKMEEQGGHVFAEPGSGQTAAIEPTDVETGPVGGAVAETTAPEERPRAAQGQPPQIRAGERPRFEGRPQSGREGRGYGRGGQRGGRQGRRGGRGGERRFGRDLPSSKYASHRPYEPRTEESAPPAGGDYTPIILPGESLAKYKERIPPLPSAASRVSDVADPTAAPARSYTTENLSEQKQEIWELPTASTGGLEPLPGESLAKAHAATPQEPEHRAESVSSVAEEHPEAEETLHSEVVELSRPEIGGHSEPHSSTELTEEEANTLAEQVAEAQLEEAERAAEQNEASETTEMGEAEVEEMEAEENRADDAGVGENGLAASASTEALEEGERIAEPGAAVEGTEIPIEGAGTGGVSSEENPQAPSEGGTPSEQQPWRARVSGDFRARLQHPAKRGRERGRRDDRGRRPQHAQGGHRPQPRRAPLISDLLKQGQEIIVQIAKEPLGKKGARITSHVALPGRYLVYMPTLDHTGVSRKIASAEERARLRHLVTEAKGSSGGGFIVRTAAEKATPDEIRTDVEFLTRTWNEIKTRAEQRKAPALLHRDLNLVERILRDYLSPDYTAIWVDTEEEFTKVVEFVSRFQPQLANRVKLYSKDTPVYEEFGIQQEIDKGLRPKVWLKSGGYIVINHTEALVAIDVNTGKFVGRGSTRLEDTIVRTNLEAVKEIVRQMRLRDLGGIIIIDFIDMEERRNREKVMAALDEALQADRAPSKVLRFNEFGLVAITRKRTKQALERTLCQPCPYCTGSGMVKSIPTLCYEIQAEARKMAPEMDAGSLTLRVHPEIAKALKTREAALVEELEHWTKKSVIIQADPALHWEQYDIY